MTNDDLSSLVQKVEGLHSAAFADADGTVEAHSLGFDADIPCAVAAICQTQLEELSARLGGGQVKDWAITASRKNLYVVRRGSSSLVAMGEYDDKPTKVSEQIAATLNQLDNPM